MLCQNLQNNIKKTNIIPIPNNINNTYQYSLTQNFFDPAKSSPPNIFMKKLYIRLSNYEKSDKNNDIFDNK
jgi:hypothetical protein